MFTPKTYILVCHGCGRFHEKVSEFISVPFSVGFDVPDDPKRRWSIPALGCPECMATPRTIVDGKEDRSKHPVANAYDKGMTPEARERANKEFIEWLPKLEERNKANRL